MDASNPNQPEPNSAMRCKAMLQALRFPVVAAPLFIISDPGLLMAACRAGVIGSMPALNARPQSKLDDWLSEIGETLRAYNLSHPNAPAAPFAVNQIVHKSNDRLEQDMAVIVKHRVPVVITSLGARPEVNDAVHSYGGVTLHDVTNNLHAQKAIEKGADGLIAVAAGAGGHAGVKSPFALIQEIRQWFDGPLILSGAMASGEAILAALAMGADAAYIGSAFIATTEALASAAYKQAIVEGDSDQIVYTDYFTGIPGNYLARSIVAAGLDPKALPEVSSSVGFNRDSTVKAWRDIWGSGQGIGAVNAVVSVADRVAQWQQEFSAAKQRLDRLTAPR